MPNWVIRYPASVMDALLIFAIYIMPFIVLVIGVWLSITPHPRGVRLWMRRQVTLSDVQAEGDPNRERSRFLWGFWRHENRDQL